mgnify:CR=1 FL=1
MTNVLNEPTHRSRFITRLAWSFIVPAGVATLIAVLQNVMFVLMFPGEDAFRSAVSEAVKGDGIPPFAAFVFANLRLLLFGFLMVCAITLVAAIGLLRRRNWARLTFIGMTALGVLGNLGAVFLSFFMFPWVAAIPDAAPEDFRANFEVMAKVIVAINVIVGVVFAGLFGWVLKRLVSRDIKEEFLAP